MKVKYDEVSQEDILRTKLPTCQQCPMLDVNIRVSARDMTKSIASGFVTPDILVVGEAPGLGDRTYPFSGPAGKFITDTLDEAGILSRSYLTNLVRCRPFVLNENGRRDQKDPTQEMIDCCSSQLVAEMYRIQPRVIITLGDRPLKWLSPKRTAKSSMGYAFTCNYGFRVVPITSPASVLRTGDTSDYARIKLVLKNLWKLVDGIPIDKDLPRTVFVSLPDSASLISPTVSRTIYQKKSEMPVYYSSTPRSWYETKIITWERAIELIDNATCVVADLETTGLNPDAEDADILSCSFAVRGPDSEWCGSDVGYVFPVASSMARAIYKREEAYESLFSLLDKCTEKGIWFHNAIFDTIYITTMYKRITGKEWEWKRPPRCTLVLHWMLESLSAHGLEDVIAAYGYINHKKLLADHLREKVAAVQQKIDAATAAKDKEAKRVAREEMNRLKEAKFAFADWWILGRYNAADSALTMYLLDQLEAEMNSHPKLHSLLDEHWENLLTAHHMERYGIKPDPKAVAVARAKQLSRIDRAGSQAYFNPHFLQLLIEEYGYPVDDPVPFVPTNIERHFKFNSGKALSRLLFGAYTGKGASGEKEMVECASLGLDRSISEVNSNGYAAGGMLFKTIVGVDWPVVVADHPWSELNEDGVPTLGGLQLLKAYKGLVHSGKTKDESLAEMKPLSIRSLLSNVIEYRNAKKFLSTFIDGIEKRTWSDGMVRDQIRIHGTITGRWACFLHTMPRDDKSLKRQFKSRFGDTGRIIAADQSQVEARVFASLSGDPKLLSIFREKRDLHREVAAAFNECAVNEVTEDQRNSGKSIHFATVYGTGAEALALRLVVQRGMQYKAALEYAKRFVDWYFTAFVVLKQWIDRLMREIWDNGYTVASNLQRAQWTPNFKARKIHKMIVTPMGREILMPSNSSWGDVRRYCANYATQSAAGDITNRAATRIDRVLRREKCDAKMPLTIHDAIYVDSPEDEIPFVQDVVRREMLRMDGLDWMMCDLNTDIMMGPNFGDLKKVT